MRAAAATILVLLTATVAFILLNLDPATISLFGLVRITQPIGVAVSLAFLGGALLIYLLMEGAGLRRSWRERHERKRSMASSEGADEYPVGLEALARGEPGVARAVFERVLGHDPDHVGALLTLGNLDREAGDTEAAIRRHITAHLRQPGTPAILWALAEDYARAGRLDECIRALDDLLALVSDAREALTKKRDVYEGAGRLGDAIKAAEALLRAGGPDDGSLTALRLKATQRASTPQEARAHLEAVLKHDKRSAAAYRLLGEMLWGEDNVREAEKTWKSGWKATGDVTLAHRLAEAYMASRQGKKALKLLRQASEARPGDPLPALLYAQAAIRTDAVGEAENALAAESLADHPAAALLRLELAHKEGGAEAIRQKSQEAAAALGALHGPYACRACGTAHGVWAAQCPACKRWDTIQIAWIETVPPPEAEGEAPEDEPSSEPESDEPPHS
ncbi:MAG: tetratricopeptide repeat protein [Nitrospinota bacterium]